MAGKTPVKLTKRHYDKVRRLAANGLSRVMIAKELGMCEQTLYRRIKKDARLEEALTIGDSEDLQLCVSVLREKALNGSAMHMDRYLQLRHSIYVGGAKPCGYERGSGSQPLIVVVPFETGQERWQGDVIEHGAQQQQMAHEVTHNLIHDQTDLDNNQ